MKRLVLVDGNALLHRAYHATPPLSTSKGELINAVYGFTAMLLKAINELHPDYTAVAWDTRAPTFRHAAYESYKANRKPLDDGLAGQYDRVFQVIKTLNIPEYKLPGFEADDLVGALAKQAEKKEKALEIIILTGDRDILQLIDKRIKVLMPKKTMNDVGLYGEEEFAARFGFAPKNMVDYKALAGDASDNVPGVPGIGEVTATKLIQRYGTIEKLYKHLNEAPERMRGLLEDGRESAKMSKKLVTIETDIPIKLDLAKCRLAEFDAEAVKKLFEELEFRSLINKIPGVILASEARQEFFSNDKNAGQASMTKKSPNSELSTQNQSTTDLDHLVEPILTKMSEAGVLIDRDYLEKMGKGLKVRLTDLEKEIHDSIGHDFNLNSPKQLGGVLFDELKLQVVKKTKTGRSTDEETLRELRDTHPMVPLILRYRQLYKLVSTYIDALPKAIAEDGRIHSTFNVEGAATGRLSSQNPNLQNIPVRGELGGEIRRAFIAPKGKVLLAADYSQIELRIMAHLADDPGLKKAFQSGVDIHAVTAAKIFGVPLEEVKREQRAVGKTMNFATLYGQGAHALSRQLGVDYATARSYIEEYFAQFPSVRVWMNKVLEQASKDGFVETLWGRRRYIPELSSNNRAFKAFGERAAVNHPVQGCLPWETRVLTSSGYIPIGELYVVKEKPPFVWDGSQWKSYEVLDRGKAQLARITFSNGQIFKCDVRHKVLTVDENGYKWTEFSKLKPGTKVCFSQPMTREFPYKQFNYYYTSRVHNGIPLKLTLNGDLWYWLGYYIGDGYLYKRWKRAWVYTLTYFFGEHEEEKLKQCVQFFTSLGLHPTKRQTVHRPSVKLSTRYLVTVHSQGLGKLFEKIGLLSGKNAHTKCLPFAIFTESLKHRRAFMKGIMDSDGHEQAKEDGSPNIHLCQRELLQEIQLLLRTLGVESRIRGPYTYKDRVSYRLDMHRDALARVLRQGERSSVDRYVSGMTPQFLVQEAVCLGGHLLKSQFATLSDAVLYSRWKYGGSSGLSHFQTWLSRNHINLQTPVYLFNEIVKIEVLDEYEDTYTLSVLGSHRFDSEGVISKNTAADMIKKAMVEISQELNKIASSKTPRNDVIASEAKQSKPCQMILQVHDELLFECDPKAVKETAKMVKEKMENALKLSVPVVVDLKAGQNWGEMEPLRAINIKGPF